ncbi:MAG: hypothetical protein OEN23_03890 [Paracoccaceae bacterium]|nr:hypothetical protein [Paracoccaceae bacterium]
MRETSEMHARPLLQARLSATLLLLCFSALGTSNANVTNVNDADLQRDFTIAGLTLGTDFKAALVIYPDAQLEYAAPNCYRFGQAIKLPQQTPRILRGKALSGALRMHFDPPVDGGRLSRIEFDRPVDPQTFDIQAVVDRLERQYGSYDRQLLRRKMEPAGRVVGFEWHQEGRATLRVELREDHSEQMNYLRLKFLAWSPSKSRRHEVRKKQSPCDNSRLRQ